MEPVNAWSELIKTLANNHLTEKQPVAMDTILNVLVQVLSKKTPEAVQNATKPEPKANPVKLLNEVDSNPPLVLEKPTQESLIRDSFVLAGLGNSDAYDKLIAAIKSRGSPLNKMNIEEWSTVIEFLHPELVCYQRAKLATILSVVL